MAKCQFECIKHDNLYILFNFLNIFIKKIEESALNYLHLSDKKQY